MRIVYLPLEPYESRYTLQLREWNIKEFERLGVDYIVIDGAMLDNSKQIKTGLVLDAHNRSYFALSQCMKLVEMHYKGELTTNDFIYFEDMFHPGIEALAYCLGLTSHKGDCTKAPMVGVRCLAQTIDPDDFVHYTGLSNWMRNYEAMVNAFVDVVFINSEEMLPYMTAAGWVFTPVEVTGLPFGKQEILKRAGTIHPFQHRPLRVSFASRIADEKQPEFFLAVARAYKQKHGVPSYWKPVVFEILSGGRISHPLVDQAVIDGTVEVYPELTKEQYYAKLSFSRVLFNCSLQDWGSVVLPEADTLGCNVLFPAYHSFPEVFDNDHTRMYIPWSVDDAVDKLDALIMNQHPRQGEISDYQDKTIERTLKIIKDLMSDGYTETGVYPDNINYRKRITARALKGFQR